MLHKPTPPSLPPSPPKIPRKCRRSAILSSNVSMKMGKTNPVKQHKRKELEESVQEHGNQEESTDGDAQEQDEGWETTKTTATSRAKRSRRAYSLEAADVSKKKSTHSQSPPLVSRVDEDLLKPTSKSTGCDSSASNSEDRGGDQESEPSSGKELKLTEELESLNFSDKQTRDDHSSFSSDCVDAAMETVQVTVNASPVAENVPFVSLTSEAYGIAVIGYPLDVGEIRDGSDTPSLPKESADCNLSGDRVNRLDKLVWRTSKRTPVCYVNVRREASVTKNMKQLNRDKTAKNKGCVPVKVIFSKILAAVD